VIIHPTALIEAGVRLGAGTAVWDHVHIRRGASIGSRCIIGEKTYIAYDVTIGDLVKINAFVYLCAGVTIEDLVMVSAGTVFTNDRCPRAAIPERAELITSAPTDRMLRTIVRRGATIGANATIGPGLELGEFCMVGMGAVVTKPVRPFQLVVGCPARAQGWVCVCGEPLAERFPSGAIACEQCSRSYVTADGGLRWVQPSRARAAQARPGRMRVGKR
jgi:acetyltransferase-like isoleucine patch superfamily enzyme